MDKYEYKMRSEQIKALISEKEYAQAAEIADTIDWRRVRSVAMLCMISDLYKINRRYEDARELLLLAYERHPGGRSICYSLCELSIKMEEFVQAVEYYKEFVQAAPKDAARYILQYKLYEAQDVSLEERIAVLEEYKKREYREKWAYELAYLYHRVGLSTKCVEECDELILWFGEGKYVIKAMELKMLHEPLTPQQQGAYNNRFRPETVYIEEEPEEDGQAEDYESGQDVYEPGEGDEDTAPGQESEGYEDFVPEQEPEGYEDFVPEQEPEGYEDTAPEQESEDYEDFALEQEAEDYEDFAPEQEAEDYEDTVPEQESEGYEDFALEQEAEDYEDTVPEQESEGYEDFVPEQEPEGYEDFVPEQESEGYEDFVPEQEPEGYEDTVPEQESEGYEDSALEQEEEWSSEEQTSEAPEEETGEENIRSEQEPFRAETTLAEEDILKAPTQIYGEEYLQAVEEALGQSEDASVQDAEISEEAPEEEELDIQVKTVDVSQYNTINLQKEIAEGLKEVLGEEEYSAEDYLPEESSYYAEEGEEIFPEEDASEEPQEDIREDAQEMSPTEPQEELPEELAEVLSQESDGQISLVLEEEEKIEKQITGQLTIADVLKEWEKNQNKDYQEKTDVDEDEEAAEGGGSSQAEEAAEDEGSSQAEEAAEGEGSSQAEEAAEDEESSQAEEAAEDEGSSQAEEAAEDEGSQEAEVSEKEEEETDGKTEEPAKKKGGEQVPVERDKVHVRKLTREERELFAPYLQKDSDYEKLVKVLDGVSLAAYTGNVIVTGDEGLDTFTLAKNIVVDVQMSDSNFSGKTAKISGNALNQENITKIVEQLINGALIIQKASAMNGETAEELYKNLQKESMGIIVILEDTRRAMNRFLAQNEKLAGCFNARMDLEALSNEALVAYGKEYAREKEYSIDEFGVLALHTRIEDMQSSDHAVTVMEVRDIVDEAIKSANRKNIKHFCDILLAKRYDNEDMIILREKDFLS